MLDSSLTTNEYFDKYDYIDAIFSQKQSRFEKDFSVLKQIIPLVDKERDSLD